LQKAAFLAYAISQAGAEIGPYDVNNVAAGFSLRLNLNAAARKRSLKAAATLKKAFSVFAKFA
jgi:hypothetical protein